MKYVKLLLALAVVCVLSTPAFSQPNGPDNGVGPKNNNHNPNGQNPVGPNNSNNNHGPFSDQVPAGLNDKSNNKNPCDGPVQLGPDGKPLPCDNQNSKVPNENMPKDGQKPIGQFQDHRPPVKSIMGPDDNHFLFDRPPVKSIMGLFDGQMPIGPDEIPFI